MSELFSPNHPNIPASLMIREVFVKTKYLPIISLVILLVDFAIQDAHAMRWYSPSAGNWLSRDPIGEQGGLNLYGFVRNEPINWLDYFGEHGPEIFGSILKDKDTMIGDISGIRVFAEAEKKRSNKAVCLVAKLLGSSTSIYYPSWDSTFMGTINSGLKGATVLLIGYKRTLFGGDYHWHIFVTPDAYPASEKDLDSMSEWGGYACT